MTGGCTRRTQYKRPSEKVPVDAFVQQALVQRDDTRTCCASTAAVATRMTDCCRRPAVRCRSGLCSNGLRTTSQPRTIELGSAYARQVASPSVRYRPRSVRRSWVSAASKRRSSTCPIRQPQIQHDGVSASCRIDLTRGDPSVDIVDLKRVSRSPSKSENVWLILDYEDAEHNNSSSELIRADPSMRVRDSISATGGVLVRMMTKARRRPALTTRSPASQ